MANDQNVDHDTEALKEIAEQVEREREGGASRFGLPSDDESDREEGTGGDEAVPVASDEPAVDETVVPPVAGQGPKPMA